MPPIMTTRTAACSQPPRSPGRVGALPDPGLSPAAGATRNAILTARSAVASDVRERLAWLLP